MRRSIEEAQQRQKDQLQEEFYCTICSECFVAPSTLACGKFLIGCCCAHVSRAQVIPSATTA